MWGRTVGIIYGIFLYLWYCEGFTAGAADPEGGRRRRQRRRRRNTFKSVFLPSWGSLGRALGALLGILGASWGLLGRLLGPPGAEGSKCRLVFPLSGASWGSLGALVGRLRGLLGRLGAVLGRLGAVLGASWAVLERRETEKARRLTSF